ncbi:hypothetical protein Tco_0970550 [Tanacetum coccineum]
MVEEVTSLKKDFKQKENKYLEEFLDMKALKEKVEDKLYKQDQSLQTVHMLCRPKPYYDEQRKVAIGYKNLLCLTRVKQVQPALYNGHEIIKTHHVPAIVHNSEDTLEIAEITRKKMNDKMKTPMWTEQNIILTLDYRKRTILAIYAQTQLTPCQIFLVHRLSSDESKALKEQTHYFKETNKAFDGVSPNHTCKTPCSMVLLTKSQVKINIFALIQLFSEFEKTCKKRITPTGLTEGERGFEQTWMYLTEKNLLIANDNLIADCLSKEVFYIATNSELTVSRFTEMHDAHTVVQARCLELEAYLSKLKDKNQKDDHNELITQLTEKVTSLQEQKEPFRAENSKIKQHYKELYDSINITRAKHIEQTTALLTDNENLKAQIHEDMKCITIDSVKPRVFAPGKYVIDVEPIPPRNRNTREVYLDYLKHLKESVETLREIVEEAKVERPLDRSLAYVCFYTKHSQELLEYVIGTCPKDFNKRDKKHSSTPLTRKKQVTFEDQCETSNNNTHKHVEQLNIQKTNVPVIPSTGLNSCIDASGSKSRSNTKKNRISPAKSVNKKKVEEHPRTNKSSLKNRNHVDSSISSKRTVIDSNSHFV